MLKLTLKKGALKAKTLEEAQLIIEKLCEIVRDMAARIEDLEEQIGRGSGNSSQPPSQDSAKQRAERKKKKRSVRKQGAQPGHRKHQRELVPEDQVNQVERFYPVGRCSCGGPIETEAEPSRRHQVFDLPEVRYTVTEYQTYSGCCGRCGTRHVGELPSWVPRGQMGAGLISWIALLSGQYQVTTRALQSLLREQWDLEFSLGAISQAQRPVSTWLEPIYAQIGESVRQSKVAHADETSHYRGAERRWLWALCMPTAVYFLTHYSRGKGAAKELLRDFEGILISDRHGGYNDYPVERRQLCWAHILRNLECIAGRSGRAGKLGRRLVRLAQLTVRLEHRWRVGGYGSILYEHRLHRLRAWFRRELEHGAGAHGNSRTGNQCSKLLREESMLWTFLSRPGIPLTNNAAERALRPYVIWRKISFFSQSYRGDQFRPLILSITETCKRLQVGAYQILRRACEQGLRGDPVTVRLPIPNAQPSPALPA